MYSNDLNYRAMKINKILILAVLACAFSACTDLFNPAVENAQTEEQMFKDASSAQGVLGYAYANLPFETKSTTDIATDDAVTNDLDNAYRRMSQGTWAANNDPLSQWQSRRIAIQYMNLFLSHVNEVEWSKETTRQTMFVDKLTGEALALRALNMYYLLRNHSGWTADGQLLGVPIILEPEGFGSDFDQPRATFKECVDQMYEDLDKAIELLPFDYVNPKTTPNSAIPQKYQDLGVKDIGEYAVVFGDSFNGRISGRIAQAIKGLTALLAASPAYAAGSGVTYADAADEIAVVLNTINGVSGVDKTGYKWFMEKSTINNLASGACPPEILWRGSKNNGTEDYAFGISQERDNYPPTLYGRGRINPTQNFVDAFPMADGTPIAESADYNPNNPYEGRDPRLAEYVIYNGAKYAGATINTGLNSTDNNGLNKIATSTRTGYYLRKLLRDDCNANPSSTNPQYHYPVYIRYTELFLGYAEAANEAWGPTGAGTHGYSAYDVIKALHDRAGVGNAYLDSISSDKDKMRELIRNERRIELSFENKRFWDMRRWNQDITEPAMGVKIEQEGGALKYTEFEVEPRSYKDYMYYGPIPELEVLKWSNLDQNKGW